jgi:hypothetical protein
MGIFANRISCWQRDITARLWLVAAVALCLATPLDAQSGSDHCIITRVDGVAVVSARGAGRHSAEPGLGLGRNATLRTRRGARVTMTCADGLKVVIGPDSRITVAGVLDGATRPFGLRVLDGIAGFLFDRGDGDGVQVRTPSAVAAVLSTEWAMRVQDGASAVFARDGSVFVVADGGTVRLGAGDGVDVTRTGSVGPVVRWGQARIDLFDGLLGPDW